MLIGKGEGWQELGEQAPPRPRVKSAATTACADAQVRGGGLARRVRSPLLNVALGEESPGRAAMAEKGIDLAGRLALRPKEAARALGVSERTLRQMRHEIPCVTRAGVVLYPIESLREWLRRHAEASEGRIDRIVKEELDALSGDG